MVPPVAPGPAPGNTYYFNSFNFNDLASTLIFQATSTFSSYW
ncbi:Cell surface antigen Sca9 [Rickettsia rickettsii str. Colombia]|nr:Cell surface antigen Sca9 [Rickettsia rickettsii str. Brazil]AFB24169.1 Cell surface antigen Sca9 [Rickettsia rickettsii str. Colombia]